MTISLTAFWRRFTVGSRWTVDNKLHPQVSGERVITAAGPTVLRYDFTKADGTTGANGYLAKPKAAEVRVRYDQLDFLMPDGSVAFTWRPLEES